MNRSELRILITAGPTHEPIDAVRYLANRSSGRLGNALARAAAERGHDVTLLLGPTPLPPTPDVRSERFVTTADLEALLSHHFPNTDVLIMAAAVADFTPARADPGKIGRTTEPLRLELRPTPDLVAQCAATKHSGQKIIGFSLEMKDNCQERAMKKLREKKLDAIIANPLQTMDSQMIDAILLRDCCDSIGPGPLSKTAFAAWLIEQIEGMDVSSPRGG